MVHWLWGVVFSVDTNLHRSPMRRSSLSKVYINILLLENVTN